ncbi:RHS repeat-associated core domain-containing protein [Maioricimonas sp. JC845]|uniref:RHS repeat domain-containing protein n=1 Tax=Maioricimonas sp. JC845 TaxID=3232138 RepID=UPI00345B1805
MMANTTGSYTATYDELSRRRSVSTPAGHVLTYAYDSLSRRVELHSPAGRFTYSYDANNRLTGKHRSGTSPYRNTYSYDPTSNRLLKNEDGTRTTYSYDAANQLVTSLDSSGTTTYTFDADGNQQLIVAPSGNRTTTTWDFENRTTLVELPDATRNTMLYEPEGLRVQLDDSTGTTKFVWDDQNYLIETDASDALVAAYTNEPRVYGDLISQYRKTNGVWLPSSYHYDALGSTHDLTDSLESITDTYLYDAWGNIVSSTGTTENPFRYIGNVGYYLDSDTDKLYVRARIYSPTIGRWWNIDPVGMLDGLNFFLAYFVPDGIDPSGELTQLPNGFFGPSSPSFSYCNMCPPVTCQDVHGNAPLPDGFPIAEIGAETAKDVAPNLRCSIKYKIGDCGLAPDQARTCAGGPPERYKRTLYICIQSGTTRCQAEYLLAHELVHARQLCNQKSGQNELGGECVKNESAAYEVMCKHKLAQDCIFQGQDDRYGPLWRACVANGIVLSCSTLPGRRPKPCDDVIHDVFVEV